MMGSPTLDRAAIVALTVLVCAGCALFESAPPAPVAKAPPKAQTQAAAKPPEPVIAPPPREPVAPPREKSRAEQEFERGIKSYEDGDYNTAARQFQSALDLQLPTLGDQANAHKYLAFIACASGRQRPCRDEFRKALDADRAFDLSPAEAGHPVWGPVFRSVKSESAKATKATQATKAAKDSKAPPKK